MYIHTNNIQSIITGMELLSICPLCLSSFITYSKHLGIHICIIYVKNMVTIDCYTFEYTEPKYKVCLARFV